MKDYKVNIFALPLLVLLLLATLQVHASEDATLVGSCEADLAGVVKVLESLSNPRPVVGSGQDSHGVVKTLAALLPQRLLQVNKQPEPAYDGFSGRYVPENPGEVDAVKFEVVGQAKAVRMNWISNGRVVRTFDIGDALGTTPVQLTVAKANSGYEVSVNVQHPVGINWSFGEGGSYQGYDLRLTFSERGQIVSAVLNTTDVQMTWDYPDYTYRTSRLNVIPPPK